jgi:hypothetical protein
MFARCYCSSRPAVSSLSAAIPYAASRHTAVPGSVTLLSRADVVPCKAATDLAKGRAWPDTEEVTGSNPVAPTTVLAGHSVVGHEPVSLTSWLGRAGAAPHLHRRARGPFQARLPGDQARQRPRSVVVLQAKLPATPRCSNALGPALPCPGSAGSDGRPHVGLASSWPVSGRVRSQPAPGPDPARSATAAPPPAYPPPPQHRPQADSAVDQAARDTADQVQLDPSRP